MTSTVYLTYISEMLATHDAVVIPGFGGFISKYRSARIDDVAGHIHPPAKYIAFNEQLNIHDNTFAKYLDEQTSVAYSPRLFDEFVAQLKNDLATNQVIVVPEVGRIYQDYEGQTHFMPDLENLNNDAFGLPKLSYIQGAWAQKPLASTVKTLKDGSLRTTLSSAATVIMLFALVWIGTGMLGNLDNSSSAELSIVETVIDSPRISEPIREVQEDHTAPLIESEADETISKIEMAPSPSPSVQQAVIIVGAFGSDINAGKMKEKVTDLGFVSYQDRPGKLYRVGLTVTYQTEEELETMLTTVQKSITSKAWILN